MPGQLHHYLTATLRPFRSVGYLDRCCPRVRRSQATFRTSAPSNQPPWTILLQDLRHAGPRACCARRASPLVTRADAGARHRRQHRDLLDRQRRDPAAARLPEARAVDVPHQPVPGAGLRPVLGVAAGVLRVPRAEPVVRGGRRVHDRRGRTSRPATARCACARPRSTDDLFAALGVPPAQGRCSRRARPTSPASPAPGHAAAAAPQSPSSRTSCGSRRSAAGRSSARPSRSTACAREVIGIMPPGARRDGQPHRDLAAARPQPGQPPEPRQPLPLPDRPAEGRRHAGRRRRPS